MTDISLKHLLHGFLLPRECLQMYVWILSGTVVLENCTVVRVYMYLYVGSTWYVGSIHVLGTWGVLGTWEVPSFGCKEVMHSNE